MGIRINKVLGYGLTDVKTAGEYNDKLIDKRFNPKGYFAGSTEEQEEKFNDEGFDVYLEAQTDADLGILRGIRQRKADSDERTSYHDSLYHRIIYDSEFGMPNVMVFQPPNFGDNWSRYDDIIDYYDPQQTDADGGSGVGYVMVPRSLYPFEGYQDHRQNPPVSLKGNDWHWYIDGRNSKAILPHALEALGFETEEEMGQYIHPMIPKELVAMLKYCKVFKKDEYIYQLRPMIYWYWS